MAAIYRSTEKYVKISSMCCNVANDPFVQNTDGTEFDPRWMFYSWDLVINSNELCQYRYFKGIQR